MSIVAPYQPPAEVLAAIMDLEARVAAVERGRDVLKGVTTDSYYTLYGAGGNGA